ncbi:MAG: glycosyltransferase family 2 protein [Candidatus Brocadia sp. AMX2]|uniref:Glycosyltransferase 2-like domain-containing protein n=1 Tax=Candidatus Brocadia sinica JPN1 TaxID=1197129 RepID=A0ABQ0JWL3_9BACT|nr:MULTISPECIES: glycosyltransferase family A protein [Brocadia]KXK29598.1 MAG: glycosyltransferase family 2 [Candidatus Brocadia sinica]MBC6931154.1 glycosyltransferase family 2 protein [Candidatus Brocadia sp.]MBL1167447.1 glycosyltransferase family 2 protein [Candidatus Brocadia sp. AMX1]NOG41080.1 glycosyltransferase family 2 protein [Planctomycetota bacterium]KAA0244681.1 MAG: glycosyltransferase family 2 protein [Candidatus Brocadia sp. AMX2]
MDKKGRHHIVIIEGYEGYCEFLSDETEERISMRGLGLPVEEISEYLDCRITILCWSEWYHYETGKTWVPTPATRPVLQPNFDTVPDPFRSERVKRIPIPARDPEYWLPFDEKGLSPRSHGLINDGGLLSFVSYCLNKELQVLYKKDPFQVIILPMWGGLGYVSQMAKATKVPDTVDVPFVVAVTDKSVNRQMANQEGIWIRHAIIRRQMEDVSLALADLVLVFGPRGNKIAIDGRLPESSPPVFAPRFIDKQILDAISHASAAYTTDTRKYPGFFLYEPQQASSGVLTALDAVTLLTNKGVSFKDPVISAGPSMVFAPMKPRDFVDYWSSRGFVKDLVREQQWEWRREYPQHPYQIFPVRLYPSFFDHLPNVWHELAKGSFVLLSPAAAEGLAPGENLPEEILIRGDPTPENVADFMGKIMVTDVEKLDQIRRELCKRIISAHCGNTRQCLITKTTAALEQLLHSPHQSQNLSRVALMFLDRRISLRAHAEADKPPLLPEPKPHTRKGTLTVVVTCYEMGSLIKDAITSVWASERQPDEVLLINDGSHGKETHSYIRELQKEASLKGLPLTVIHKQNQGLAAARNTGLEAANGEFISFLDGDDMIEPPFYRIALQILDKYPRLGGVAAWAFIFGNDIPDGFWNAPQTELPFLFIENSVIVPCLTRTELLQGLGSYDTRQRYNYEDWELGVRMLASGWPIITIPMHLTRYRVRRDSLYRSMTSVQNQVMRELMLNTHRETVSKFTVEIAMQLENQLKQYVYTEQTLSAPYNNSNHTLPLLKIFLRKTGRIITHLLTN